MGYHKNLAQENEERALNTCPDCESEYSHSDSTGNHTCKCGVFEHICKEPNCSRGYNGDSAMCDQCFRDKVDRAP